MTARFVLAAAGLLVLGASVYLLLEIRATPAEAQPSPAGPAPERVAAAAAEPDDEPGDAEDATPAPHRRSPRLGDVVRRARPAPSPASGGATPAPATDPDDKPYRLDALMNEANKAYDRMDFDEARTIAQRILKKDPDNIRMLRIMVSAACIEGDGPEAQKWFVQLPERHREQMKTRCMKYSVTFVDPPR